MPACEICGQSAPFHELTSPVNGGVGRCLKCIAAAELHFREVCQQLQQSAVSLRSETERLTAHLAQAEQVITELESKSLQHVRQAQEAAEFQRGLER